jgi:D-tyrosyl-tRNA(Tyr) deacylase
MRIFDVGQGKMNLSVLDINGGVLIVPQFTLYANVKGARRPDFIAAARPETAEPLFEKYVAHVRAMGAARVEMGVFRAMMNVEIHNDGPVTIWLDTATL